ncbi:hypothetical protein diail_8278 [Diaporthe ilicicola]|nr:hypothetical protein diail_8278 [Diaporthe ilicicola]
MVSRVLFWAGFGVATRMWQLGLQQIPITTRSLLWAYPVFAGCGASFGYWLETVDQKQTAMISERKDSILAKRARRAAREAEAVEGA